MGRLLSWIGEKSGTTKLLLAGLLGFVLGVSDFVEGIDKILVFLHIRPDAFSVAEETAKSSFSKALIRQAWGRVYLTQRFLNSVEFELPEDQRNAIWASYTTMLADWNSELMNNILGLRQYYGDRKSSQFELRLQAGFARLSACVTRLKYPSHFPNPGEQKCVPTNPDSRGEKSNIEILQELIDDQYRDLYCFATGLAKGGAACEL